jgi:hypothetical protein
MEAYGKLFGRFISTGLCFLVNKLRVNNYLHISDHLLCCLGPPNIGDVPRILIFNNI